MSRIIMGRRFLFGVQTEKVCIEGFDVIECPKSFVLAVRAGQRFYIEIVPNDYRLLPVEPENERFRDVYSIIVPRTPANPDSGIIREPIDLRRFCSKDKFRHSLLKPFTIGDYTYAASGPVCVRVEARSYFGPPPEDIKVEELGWPKGKMERMFRLDLPKEWPEPKITPCENCDGEGKIAKCGECEGAGFIKCNLGHDHDCPKCNGRGFRKGISETCQECKGDGVLRADLFLSIGAACFNRKVIGDVLELPGLLVAQTNATGPSYFTFNGGDGLMMPVRVDSAFERPTIEIPMLEVEERS